MKNTSRLLVTAATLPTIRDRPRRRVRGRARAVDPNEAPRLKSGSWTETVYRVVIAADRLMTMDELRDAVAKVRTLEKAWISGVQRLKDSGHIVSYKSERLPLGNDSWRRSRLVEPGTSQPSVIAPGGVPQFVRCSSTAPGT